MNDCAMLQNAEPDPEVARVAAASEISRAYNGLVPTVHRTTAAPFPFAIRGTDPNDASNQ